MSKVRNLHIVLGDQLDLDARVFDGFDAECDVVWMAEVMSETGGGWAHKLRLAFFFSAMRHFRRALETSGKRVVYHEMGRDPSADRGSSFDEVLSKDIERLRPEKLIVVHPGDDRAKEELLEAARAGGLEFEIRDDDHFYDTIEGFGSWASGKKSLLLENYYRHMRKKHSVLVDESGQPVGGQWNYDKENRGKFGAAGPPGDLEAPECVPPDKLTREVLELVETRFGSHPGNLDSFDLPVTREGALTWLDEFIARRLSGFGVYQDAMWEKAPFLYHSRLSCLLNVKLLSPRECVNRAVQAYEQGEAPLNSVEGFVRQVLGWREFVRGIYWANMPGYLDRNFFDAEGKLPAFFWDGETDMRCVRDAMWNVLQHGYAHHIQRLMVLGQFALLYGANPRAFHDWHMAMYLDAIDWVSAPNTIGMSQFADGGIVGTKPYCASGNYINRMSNHCRNCRFKPGQASGDDACPFTVFYWDFLGRNLHKIRDNHRMTFQVRNYERKSRAELEAISMRADELRKTWG